MNELAKKAEKAMDDWVTIVGPTYKSEFERHTALKDAVLEAIEPTLKRELGMGRTKIFAWISFAGEADDDEAIWIGDDGRISVQGGIISENGGHEEQFGVDYITLSDAILKKLTKVLLSDITAVSSCEQE